MKVYYYKSERYVSLNELRWALKDIAFPTYPGADLLAELGVTVTDEPEPEPTAEELLWRAKQDRYAEIDALTVEIDGLVFDANEQAQSRMARVVEGMQAVNKRVTSKIMWVLADDTVAEITLQQLKAALAEAMQKTTEIWVKPYAK